MRFRLAKPSDAKELARIHSAVKEVNDRGIFVMMGGPFLREYYRLVMSDINSICVCAEENGKVLGFSFSILDSEAHHKYLMRHKFSLAFSAISTIIIKPKVLGLLFKRYKSLKSNDGKYIAAEGDRGGFWGWEPKAKNPEASLEVNERALEICKALGVYKVYSEIDVDNKKVFKYAKLNGVVIDEYIDLDDGRKRAIMHYDLLNRKPVIKLY